MASNVSKDGSFDALMQAKLDGLMKQSEQAAAGSLLGVSHGMYSAASGPMIGSITTSAPTPRTVTSYATTDAAWFSRSGVDPLNLLGVRLRLPREQTMQGENIGFPAKSFSHIHVFADAEKVRIFYVKDGVSNTIEEDANIFPSDGLVAQFKLLLG